MENKMAEIKVGDKVLVRTDDGKEVETFATSEPWELGHGHMVIKLEGFRGGYDLDRVRKPNGKV